MKDDKICFSKTLTYLVLLVAVVFGAFWVMNVANTQKLGANPKAAAGDCIMRVSGISYNITNGACVKDSVPYYANNSYICKDGNPWGKDDTCAPGTATGPTCVAGKITAKSGVDGCYYQRGPGKISNGRCIIDSTSGAACAPAVGSLLAGGATAYDCKFSYGGATYGVAVDTCFAGQTAIVGSGTFPTTMSEKCISKGVVRKTAGCTTGAAAVTCVAGKITAKSGVDGCYYQRGPGKISNGRCIIDSTSGAACAPAVGSLLAGVTAETICAIPYGGEIFKVAVGDCLKDTPAVNGVTAPINSIRCNAVGSYSKMNQCAPQCQEYLYCPDGIAYGSNDPDGNVCKCFDATSTTEKPSIQAP